MCIGVGDKHTISSFIAAIPERCEAQTFYIKVPERFKGRDKELAVPVDAIRDALLSVQIEYLERDGHGRVARSVDARVLKGEDYLFPAGVQPNDISLYGKPLGILETPIEFVVEDTAVTLQQLQRYCTAATLNIVRAYNFALAKLELDSSRRSSVLTAVIDLANQELAFITSLRDRVVEEDVTSAEIEAARMGIHAAARGAVSSASVALLRKTVRRMRDPAGGSSLAAADDIVNILRELRNRVQAPPNAESVALANNLLDVVGRGCMGSGSVASLLGKIARRQNAGLYDAVANDLEMYEEGIDTSDTLQERYASPEADLLDSLVTVKPVCTATFECIGALVAVGSLERSLAGCENPLLTRVVGPISREPWKIQAVRLAGDGGFRASAGFANGVVGVFPGDSRGAAIALRLIASNMATGDWNTAVHGLRSLIGLLAGVVYLLKQSHETSTESSIEFANLLTHGFIGVAARTKCRVLSAAGTADLTTPLVSGLSACRTLLLRAFLAPFAYTGTKIMSADYWLALEFALRYAAPLLGENYEIPERPAEFTQALVNSSIARFAMLFVTPRASTSDRDAFDEQKRVINQFIKNVPLFVGQTAEEAAEDVTAAASVAPLKSDDIK